jgi:hypothetical protein
MGLFEELTKRDPIVSNIIAYNMAEGRRTQEAQEKYLSDPQYTERLVSHYAHTALPEKEGAKIARNATLDRIEKAIPDDDPRKRLGSQVLAQANAAIVANPNMHPQEVVANLYKNKYLDILKTGELHNYLFENESNISGKKANTDVPLYNEYKAARMADFEKNNPIFSNPLHNLAAGALFQTAAEGIAKMGWKGAIKAAGPLVAKLPHPLARIAGAGMLMATAAPIADVVMSPITQSQWAAANPLKTLGVRLVTDVAAMHGIERGVEGLISSVLKKDLGAVNDMAANLAKDPSLKNILGFDDAEKTAALAKEKVTVATPRPEFWEKADFEEIGKLTQGGMPLEEATGRVSSGVMKRQTSFDEVTKVGELNQARKDADVNASVFANRVDTLRKMFPTEDMSAIVQRASKSPGIIEDALVELKSRGFDDAALSSMNKNVLLRTAYEVGTRPRPLDTLAEVEHKLSTRLEAGRVEEQFQNNLWSKYNQLTEDFTKTNIGKVRNMPTEELLLHREKAQELNRMGILNDAEYRSFDKIYRLAEAPVTEKELFSKVGPQVASQEWQNSAVKHIDLAVKEGDYNKWDSVISHFTDNVDLKFNSKDYKSFQDKLTKFVGNPDVSAMYEKEGLDTAKTFNRIVYGNPVSETKNMVRQHIDDMIKQGIPSDTISKELQSRWGNTWSKFAGVTAVTGLGMATVGDLIGPAKADAAGLDATTRIVPKMLRAFAEQRGVRSFEEAITEMAEKGYAFGKLTDDGYGVATTQKFWGMTPDVSDVKRMNEIHYIQDKMTPGAQAQILFHDWASPQPQAAYMTTMAHNNSDLMLQAVRNVLREVPEYARVTKEVEKEMFPFVQKYGTSMSEASWLDNAIETIDTALAGKYKQVDKANALSGTSKYMKDVRTGKRTKLDATEEDQVYTLMKLQDDYKGQRALYDDAVASYGADWEVLAKNLASKYSSSRIALAVEDVGMKEGDAWLAPMLSERETFAVSKIKAINEQLEAMMISVGENPIVAKEFIHHASHPGLDYKAAMKGIEKFTPDSMTGIDMAHFHHRASWSKQLMPDVEYIMERYLPDANMRVGMSEFWNTWRPFKQQMDALGYNGISRYLGNLEKGFRNTDQYGTINQWAQRVQMFEVARFIALSPSVALKHGFKVLANVANYGFGNALANIPRDLSAFVRNTRMDMGDAPKDAFEAVMKGHINTRRIYTLANDMAMYGLPKKAVDKFLEGFNDKAGFMLNASERFDRGTSFLNAMTMASKQGMTPEQSSYLVMDAVLKNNFLSGIHNPSWLRDPKTRLLFLFQGTPFKLAEQRFITAMRGSGAVADAAKESYKQLMNLKNDIIEGTQTFKAHLIKDALMNPKDLAGNSYAAQLARNILVIGATVESGKYFFDGDMWGMFHVPFVKKQEQSVNLALNPLLGAALRTYNNKDEDAFWMTDFLRKWLSSGDGDKLYFGPTGSQKLYRLNNNDIPEIYKDSKFRYIFAIPTAKTDE